MIKSILKANISIIVFAVVLFWSAGTLNWLMGWVYMGINIFFSVIATLLMDKELIVERGGIGEGAKKWDIFFALWIGRLGPISILLIAGLDKRYDWSPEISSWVTTVSLVLMILGYSLVSWAVVSNRYFSGVVRIQKERGHSVISIGPYHIIRHPGYAGMLFSTLLTPLVLESIWALIPALIAAAVTVIRTAFEDRTLKEELPGYSHYTSSVQYRLIPGVW